MHNYIEVLLGRQADGTLGSTCSSVYMCNLSEHFWESLSVCLSVFVYIM